LGQAVQSRLRSQGRRRSFAQLEAEANSLKGKPTIGTISVACALGYLDYRFAAMDWRAKHPKLAKWFNSTAETPAMKATQPPAA
jgi:glutathione S-transferase